MNGEIREATPIDALAVRDVHLASIEGLGPSAYDADVVSAWAHDRDPADYPIESENTHFVVAEREEDTASQRNGGEGMHEGHEGIIGFGWLDVEPGEHLVSSIDAEIVAVYVHPAVARDGVGSALLDELEGEARERKIETLGLWASLPALPFYLTHGYEQVTEHTHEFAPGVAGKIIELRTRL